MRVALLLAGRVVADVDLAADERLDSLLLRVLVELDGARERAVVRERDGRHLELGRAGGEVRDPAGPVEDRELGVDPGDRGFAEQRLDLAEEGRRRADAVARSELEHLRPERGVDVHDHRRLAGKVLHQELQVLEQPCRRLARIELQPHLCNDLCGRECADFHRDQLRVARLLVVDTALHDENRVGHEQVLRGRVDGVEDDDLGAARDVVQLHEHHRVALPRRHLLQRPDHASDRDDLAVPPRRDLGQTAIRLARELVLHFGERVLGDVDPERLLLEREQIRLLELPRRDLRVHLGRRRLLAAEVEDRALAEQPVGLLAPAPRECVVDHLEHPAPRCSRRVQRAALDQRLERALVGDRGVDPFREIPEGGKRAPALARGDDCRRGCLPHVLYGIEAKADLSLHDGEVPLGRVHVRRLDRDPHLGAGVHVQRHAVLRVHHGRDQRSHVLARMVRLQPGGAVRDQGVTGRVRLVERVVLRLLGVLPELRRNLMGHAVRGAALHELVLEGRHQRVDLLADRLAEVIGLGR